MLQVNVKAPEMIIEEWLQGEPSSLENERGKVILVEVFQVNCPGCFIGGLPEAIEVFHKYQDHPLSVWGLATAFEDFEINNLENLQKLVDTGEVVGQTLASLNEANMLAFNCLQYKIPFPIAWDKLVKTDPETREEEVEKVIQRDFSNFDNLPQKTQNMIRSQALSYLRRKIYDAKTFELYGLRGTPSSILIDKKGNLQHVLFGSSQGLENYVKILLDE